MLSLRVVNGIAYPESLLLPRQNVFGFCDNYKAPQFLHGSEAQDCT